MTLHKLSRRCKVDVIYRVWTYIEVSRQTRHVLIKSTSGSINVRPRPQTFDCQIYYSFLLGGIRKQKAPKEPRGFLFKIRNRRPLSSGEFTTISLFFFNRGSFLRIWKNLMGRSLSSKMKRRYCLHTLLYIAKYFHTNNFASFLLIVNVPETNSTRTAFMWMVLLCHVTS